MVACQVPSCRETHDSAANDLENCQSEGFGSDGPFSWLFNDRKGVALTMWLKSACLWLVSEKHLFCTGLVMVGSILHFDALRYIMSKPSAVNRD